MQDKNAWDIVQLWKAMGELKDLYRDQEKEIKTLTEFKNSTVEKLIIIFATLEELREGDRFIKRVFITSLVGAVLSVLGSLIVWAFQT